MQFTLSLALASMWEINQFCWNVIRAICKPFVIKSCSSFFLSWWNHFSMETEFVLVTKCYQWFFGAIFVVAKKVVIPWWCCSNQFKIFRRFFVSWLRIGWSFSEDFYSKSFAICIASRARALLVHGVDFSLGVALLLQLSMEDVYDPHTWANT